MDTIARKRQNLRQALEVIRDDIRGRIINAWISSDDIIELEVKGVDIVEVAQCLRDNPRLQFDYISCVSGVDRLSWVEVVYHVHSLPNALSLRLKAKLDMNDPSVRSLVPVWPGANWHEREAYDLVGINFEGHPDLRRIMLEDDFQGHPLRKSYPQPQGRPR